MKRILVVAAALGIAGLVGYVVTGIVMDVFGLEDDGYTVTVGWRELERVDSV